MIYQAIHTKYYGATNYRPSRIRATAEVGSVTVTPEGWAVKTCPATYRDDVTCQSCQLCQRRDRKVIVGFPAHGMRKKAAATVARG